MTVQADVVAPPSGAEIRAVLDRVLASPGFRTSPRLASFLRFVVEATLAGQADRIKGYSIAVGALGRNDTFDPQTNPIVRVEAGRLRRALERYYAGPGQHDEFTIDLPLGGYVPTFGRRTIICGPRSSAAYRRLVPGALRQRLRFVAVVTGIAASVSLTFDLAFILARQTVAGGSCPQATSNQQVDADKIGSRARRADYNQFDIGAQPDGGLPPT